MKIVELYYEKLVSTDNYSNVRFGARATFSPANEDRDVVQQSLKDYVDTQIAKMISADIAIRETESARNDLKDLESAIEDRRAHMRRLDEWMREHDTFVDAVERLTGKSFNPIPF